MNQRSSGGVVLRGLFMGIVLLFLYLPICIFEQPEKLFFVEESEVVCEQDESFATPVHDEVFSHGQDLRFGNKKTEMQEKLPEQKKMSADDITLSLFEDLQEDETKPESVEVSATVSGQKNEPETEEKPTVYGETYIPE